MAYWWDGDQLIGQQQYRADASAAREVQWVYEPGSFRPLAQVEAQGDSTQLHYIVTDLTGTARELCSEEGEVRWRGEQGAHTAKSGDLSRCGATWEMRQTKRCTVSCAIRVSCLMRKRGFTTTGIVTMMRRADSTCRRTR
ncbi:type IV secretion protein Rhs [Pectobacterium brasiliense]|nr:type IV secretion protein Rhs [Pectobacterium brasiliense]